MRRGTDSDDEGDDESDSIDIDPFERYWKGAVSILVDASQQFSPEKEAPKKRQEKSPSLRLELLFPRLGASLL